MKSNRQSWITFTFGNMLAIVSCLVFDKQVDGQCFDSSCDRHACDSMPEYEASCCDRRIRDTGFRGFRVYGEFLNWWTSDMDAPPLVTTSRTGTDRISAGVLGNSATSVLLGPDVVDQSSQGGRFGFELQLEGRRGWSLNAEYLFLGQTTDDFSSSTGILARPFFNVETGLQASNLISYPNFVAGSIEASAGTKLSAWDVFLAHDLANEPCYDSQLLLGYRGASLDEFIHISDNSLSQDAASGAPVGTRIRSSDRFDVDNQFQGFTLGHRINAILVDRWNLQMVTKLSIGGVESRLSVRGQTTTTTPAQVSSTTAAGLLALPSNSGSFREQNFAILPELAVNASYRLTPWWDIRFGYTLHYWSQVLRPGDAIDPNLNLSQLPPGVINGAALPQPRLQLSDFIAQGINVGLVGSF